MEISSIDVERKSFNTVRKGGFDRAEVEAFMKRVASILSKLEGELSVSRRQVASLEHQLVRAQEKAEEGSKSFLFAVELKQRLIAEAEAKAQEILREARSGVARDGGDRAAGSAGQDHSTSASSEAIVADARRDADRLIEQARSDADGIVAEAEAAAARLRAEAAALLDEAGRAVTEAREEGLAAARDDAAAIVEASRAEADEILGAARADAEAVQSAAQAAASAASEQAAAATAKLAEADQAADEAKADHERAAAMLEEASAREAAASEATEQAATMLEQAEEKFREAEGAVEAAREESEALVAQARSEAENLQAAADRHAERMKAGAVAHRDEIIAEARSEAEGILAEGLQRHQELSARLGELDRTIERLRQQAAAAERHPGTGAVDEDLIVTLHEARGIAGEIEAEISLGEPATADDPALIESRYARRSAGLPSLGADAGSVLADLDSLRSSDDTKVRKWRQKDRGSGSERDSGSGAADE